MLISVLCIPLIYIYDLFALVAVVKQYFEAQVYDVFVMRGNTAIFKCQIPSFVADHVDLLDWKSTDNETYTFGDGYGLSLLN